MGHFSSLNLLTYTHKVLLHISYVVFLCDSTTSCWQKWGWNTNHNFLPIYTSGQHKNCVIVSCRFFVGFILGWVSLWAYSSGFVSIHVTFRLPYSSTRHPLEGTIQLKTGWAQGAWLQWQYEKWGISILTSKYHFLYFSLSNLSLEMLGKNGQCFGHIVFTCKLNCIPANASYAFLHWEREKRDWVNNGCAHKTWLFLQPPYSRPTFSQFKSIEIRRLAMNCKKRLADLLIVRMNNCERTGRARVSYQEDVPAIARSLIRYWVCSMYQGKKRTEKSWLTIPGKYAE